MSINKVLMPYAYLYAYHALYGPKVRTTQKRDVAETIQNLIMQHTSHPSLAYVSSANSSSPRPPMITGGLVSGYRRQIATIRGIHPLGLTYTGLQCCEQNT